MTTSGKLRAVVPVKRFSAAKMRLASVLDATERAQLAQTMLVDVLGVLMQCTEFLSEVVVVTADPAARDIAQRMGAAVVTDEPERGINAAIARATSLMAQSVDDGLLVVPSDVPQVTRDVLVRAARAISALPAVAIAEAAEDGGTNLFACRPAGIIQPRFGPRSFGEHCRAAQAARVPLHILRELSVDIDRPQDLRTFLGCGSRSHTHDLLVRLNVIDRIDELDKDVGQVVRRAAAEA